MDKKYTFFWKSDSPFSQWHYCKFTDSKYPNVIFNCAEQYMMYAKAKAFKDEEIAGKILKTNHPRDQKRLGKNVKNFDSKVWDEIKFILVKYGNRLKFTQNKKLLESLLETKDTTIVEASPYDTIWGIGMAEDHVDVMDESKWKGENLLGKALTELRDEIIEENKNL